MQSWIFSITTSLQCHTILWKYSNMLIWWSKHKKHFMFIIHVENSCANEQHWPEIVIYFYWNVFTVTLDQMLNSWTIHLKKSYWAQTYEQ